jgi:hypothetical protein
MTAAAIAAALGMTGMSSVALAQASSTTTTTTQEKQDKQANTVNFAVVSIRGTEIMRLTDAVGHGAESRAKEVDKRLREVMESEKGRAPIGAIKPSDVKVEKSGNLWVVRLRDANVITATHMDAKLADMAPQALAEQWATKLRDVVSGIEVTAQENLPSDFVTIATGQLNAPAGGGAGAGTKPDADKEKAKDQKKDKDQKHKDHPNK